MTVCLGSDCGIGCYFSNSDDIDESRLQSQDQAGGQARCGVGSAVCYVCSAGRCTTVQVIALNNVPQEKWGFVMLTVVLAALEVMYTCRAFSAVLTRLIIMTLSQGMHMRHI